MPFYSNDKNDEINGFFCSNYRLKKFNLNEFAINIKVISQFITYSHLEGIDLDLKFLKGNTRLMLFFKYDDLKRNNI